MTNRNINTKVNLFGFNGTSLVPDEQVVDMVIDNRSM